MQISLNETVSVTLTEVGANVYNRVWENYSVPEKKAGDVHTTQLWGLFRDFGDCIHLGGVLPFEGGIITVKGK